MREAISRKYKFDDVEIDVQNLRVTVNSEVRPLEPKSFRLLQFLVENPERALSKDEIMGVVWPGTFVSDHSLTRAITQIRKALEDDPKAPRFIETLPTIGYRFIAKPCEVSAVEAPTSPEEPPGAKAGFPQWRLTLAAAAAAGVFFWYFLAPRAETRSEIETPATSDPRSFALSPDGKRIAYAATVDGQTQLWVRQLDSAQGKPLVKTEGGAAYPFWSPDGQSLGFFSKGKLKRIPAGGGAPQDITDAKSGRGGTWSADGVILLTPESEAGLFRVPATGGEATPITKLGWAGSHRFAQFLPDGKHFIFYAEGSPERPGPGVTGSIYLGSLDSTDTRRVTAADTAGLYVQGWLLWVRTGALVARRMNFKTGELSGDVKTVAEPVFFDTSHARLFSVSANGTVAYRGGMPTTQLVWFDRTGNKLGALAEPAEKDGYNPESMRISPDGKHVAVHRVTRDQSSDIWLTDQTRALRFTFESAGNPVWSPDGRQIAFGSGYRTTSSRYSREFSAKPADGSQGQTHLVGPLPRMSALDDWSPDGKSLLFQDVNPDTGFDLWTVALDGDRAPMPLLGTKFDEKYGRFSPDGRWIAYTSNESGRAEVYIRALTEAAPAQWQVSADGGLFPAWSHDGRELYWVAQGGRMMAASIPEDRTGQPGKPQFLFQAPIYGGGLDINTGGAQFDVSSDGRFLINTIKDAGSSTITVLKNWKAR